MSLIEKEIMPISVDMVVSTNLLHGVSLDTTMERCKEILVGIESIHEQADVAEVVGQVLEIVSNEYHLIPKIIIDDKGGFIENPIPDNVLTQSLSELWLSVSN